MGMIWLIAKKLKTFHFYKKSIDTLVLKVPVIGPLITQTFVLNFLQSLALLTQNGVHLVTALHTVCGNMHNKAIKKQFDQLITKIDAGHSLTNAVKKYPGYFEQDVIAIITVGEQSGKLGLMMAKAAQVCREKINRKLFYITTVFQPLLMIILGLLIVALIVAVYVPIFNISYAVA
jgi:type IV pilus assembly protein PilC